MPLVDAIIGFCAIIIIINLKEIHTQLVIVILEECLLKVLKLVLK